VSAFLDTSAAYALMVRTEERHQEAVRTLRDLLESGRPLQTTDYIVVETIALLQHRIGLVAVRDLVEHVLPVVSVAWVDEGLHRRGLERLIREDRRGLSFVDCVSLEFMRSQEIQDAFALDAHFGEFGFRLLPPPRPPRRSS
jgi:predicted nucleic acid-binding protein